MNPLWADPAGLPTRHAIRAALRVAALIDPQGSPVVAARETYWHVASGGTLPPPDLTMGEALLVDLGLAVVHDDSIRRTPLLDALLEGDEESAAASIVIASVDEHPDVALLDLEHVQARVAECIHDRLQQRDALTVILTKFDDTHRRLVGEIGEEIVFHAARAELADAGHLELAARVRLVSLVSDAYGYDIVAPRAHGADRLLEVKATTSISDSQATVHLSRNEADVGSRRDNWMLVLCHIHDAERRHGNIVGWAGYRELRSLLPTDRTRGRWESASLTLDLANLVPGLPSAFT